MSVLERRGTDPSALDPPPIRLTIVEADDDFWTTTSNPRVTGDGYYDDASTAVHDLVVPRMPAAATVLDAGCGDGAYTALLAAHADRVDAFDISPPLLEQARARGVPNVTWSLGEVGDLPSGRWEVVSCMGVLVCLLDDHDFDAALEGLAERVKPGGILVLRETLSGWGPRTVENAQHTGRYRPRKQYDRVLGAAGFQLEAERRLAIWSRVGRRSNHLLVYRAA